MGRHQGWLSRTIVTVFIIYVGGGLSETRMDVQIRTCGSRGQQSSLVASDPLDLTTRAGNNFLITYP